MFSFKYVGGVVFVCLFGLLVFVSSFGGFCLGLVFVVGFDGVFWLFVWLGFLAFCFLNDEYLLKILHLKYV